MVVRSELDRVQNSNQSAAPKEMRCEMQIGSKAKEILEGVVGREIGVPV